MKIAKIKKGDKVKILTGRDKGKTGKVDRVLAKKGQIIVSGVNVYKKHIKHQSEKQPGGIVELNRPLAVAKAVLVCPKCNQATRVGFSLSGKEKQRICKKCQAII